MSEPNSSRALMVDLYELTMAAAYFEKHIDCCASFELFVRHLPRERSFLLAAGIDAALDYLETLHFSEDEVCFLRQHPAFQPVSDAFFDYLRKFRFTGDVLAVDEGDVVFAEEPILQVTGPVIEAQIVETYLLSVINFETLIASKAARVVHAAQGRGVMEFGSRRAQGPEAGVRAARAAYIGGCISTSNVLAGLRYGVPLSGTAAHSWTQIFHTERESFEALLDTFPDTVYLLIDTYDSLVGAEIAASLGRQVAGVRLDSGDLFEKSRLVRDILDRKGLRETKIVASGDLNEYKIRDLVSRGAPIDYFGVGTELATSRDVPTLGVVYKLVETERAGRIEYKTKFSEKKVHSPGRKQVFRFLHNGEYHHDLIVRATESHPKGSPLLHPAMRDGARLKERLPIGNVRKRAQENLSRLPERFQTLRDAPVYPVEKSKALEQLLDEVREQLRAAQPSRAG